MLRGPAASSAASRIAFALCLICFSAGAAARSVDERFDRALHRHVQDGVVDYPAIAGDADFRAYVASLAEPVSFGSRSDELAHYINAYNALVIQGILEGLSPATLIGRIRLFKLKDWRFDGRSIDLYALEHELLIPLGEARIHFSIVCASKSCPKLRSEAYTTERLPLQLEENARAFINDPGRNRFDRGRKVAHLSAIFKWYERDFSGAAGSLQKYLARYVDDSSVARDLSDDRYAIEWNDYDWGLNGTPPSTRR
ncbi:MAG: DUF547 domain-containing protein [Burkholderiales bacterium]